MCDSLRTGSLTSGSTPLIASHRVKPSLLDGVDGHAERLHRGLKQHVVQKVHLLTAQHVLRDEQPLPQIAPLELADKVAAGYKARDVDAVTEKVIFNGIDAPL